MVLWCKRCGEYMGLREPLQDWSIDRTALCPRCAKGEYDARTALEKENPVNTDPTVELRKPVA